MKSENEIEEEDFKFKSSQMHTKNKGELKSKRKQNFDEIRSDLNRCPEGNEGSSTNVLNDDGDGDVTPQIVAFTDSEMSSSILSESSLPTGPSMDKHEDFKHANQSGLTIPESPETGSEDHSFYYISTMENKEDDNEHDENKNNVQVSNDEDSALYYCI